MNLTPGVVQKIFNGFLEFPSLREPVELSVENRSGIQ